MDDASTPTKVSVIWASGAGGPYINTIPLTSQIGITNGAASFIDGFPPLTFIPLGAGGAGPFGADFNGILNQISAGVQWYQAGGPIFHDAALSTAIGGYPKGTVLSNDTTVGLFWISLVDNNTSDPDANGANWLKFGSLAASLSAYCDFGTGSDTTGLGTSGSPWKTLQYAFDKLALINTAGQTLTINQIGTDTGGLVVNAVVAGGVNLVIGGINTAANAGIQINGSAAINVSGAGIIRGANYDLAVGSGGIMSLAGVTVGACSGAKVFARQGGTISIVGSYVDDSGHAACHWQTEASGSIGVTAAATLTQNGAVYSDAFASVQLCSTIRCNNAIFAGTPSTGRTYNVGTGAGIFRNGSVLPGNVAPLIDAATFGWYV